MGRILAVSMGSPSESRGYVTSAAAADVQTFYQAQPAKQGWQTTPIVVKEAVQWWTKPAENYQGAGLYVWQDNDNFVRLERCFGGLGGGESGICLIKVSSGEPASIAGAPQIPTAAAQVDLRLQRAGKRVTAWWRDAAAGSAGAWQTVGSTEIELPGGPQPSAEQALRVGMLLCVGIVASEISADFDAFRLWGQ